MNISDVLENSLKLINTRVGRDKVKYISIINVFNLLDV